MGAHHGGSNVAAPDDTLRLALIGSPNSGKTTLFNALTGLRAKTGNYPGVTVGRYEGVLRLPSGHILVEDLPGTYSLDPISPDEVVVMDTLDPEKSGIETPDGLLVLLDATTLRRSLALLAQVLQRGLPTRVVLTFCDELTARAGTLDVAALQRALGVELSVVTNGDRRALTQLTGTLAEPSEWAQPPVPPPVNQDEVAGWIDSVLTTADYRAPDPDARTGRIDSVLLHPVFGVLVFFAVMFAFFQVIFTVAAPLQGFIETFFGWLGSVAAERISQPFLGAFVSDALIGGLGGVLVFLPQIALLFLMISIMEAVGYMARAAFIMDRLMSRFGLEGRAFVSLLSSVACAIPGIMATRTLPSARDRLSTMMAAPLMTCSARLPVYVLLISMLVPAKARLWLFSTQGVVMFGLYLLGALSALVAAAVFQKLGTRGGTPLPFYMEMPPYRWPTLRNVLVSVWDACKSFLRKVTHIILIATVVLFLLMNLPLRSPGELQRAGVDTEDEAAVASYVLEHSYAGTIGQAVEPVFQPLGFDWRVNIGVLSSLAAREVFVATMGQVAAAQDPEEPAAALQSMTVEGDGPRSGEPLFAPPMVAALLVFFVYALQCMSTVGVLRRETGGWRWPLIAFGYMFALAWVMALIARLVVGALT